MELERIRQAALAARNAIVARWRGGGRIKRGILAAGAVVAVVMLVSLGWIWVAPCWLGGCAPVSDLAEYQAEGSEILDINEQPFGTLATVNRRVVPLDSLPPYLPQAFIAVEDHRFYSHGGLDLRRVVGAFLSNVRARGVVEGGSTITMQLARNLFPEWLPYTERGPRRKLMEARVARQIEREFSKDKILELYLNHIYLGNGAYGVEAAARAYFGKSASELTLAEAATLGGLPKAPSELDPTENPEGARERRDLVLREMVQAEYITEEEAAAAAEEPLRLASAKSAASEQRGSYFVERVRREMQELAGNRFYTAGLKIYTTLDPEAQRAAEEELAQQLDAIEAGRFGSYRHPTYPETKGETTQAGTTPYLQGAAVVIDAHTGEVRALVGGRDFDDSKFNRVTQALRQPGSAFKPFVYLTALEIYGTPAHQMEDSPIRMVLSNGQVWEPKNYTGGYEGPMTLRDALTRSKNTVTVRLSQDVGMDRIIRTAHELGINTEIPNVPATALGAAEVRPIELATAYAAFGNGGYRVEPHFIRKIVDRNGQTVWEARDQRYQVVDEATAFVLTSMLQDVVDRGTGTAVRAVGLSGPVAGKTGTTNAATDVWFVGYTPDLVGAVWMGFDDPKTIVRGASGGTLAAPAWGRMMRRVYTNRPMPAPWTAPPGVTTAVVESGTGFVVDQFCPPRGPTFSEYFIGGAPPQQSCASRGSYSYVMPSDTSWYDEEWMLEPSYLDSLSMDSDVASGIDWPELEALRRRVRREREAAGVAVDTFLSAPPRAGQSGRVNSPIPEPPPAPGSEPPGDGPRLIGTPVGEAPSNDGVTGAPPPDTTSN